MADDVFGLEPVKIEEMASALEKSKGSARETQQALDMVAQISQKTAELKMLDAKETRAILEATKELEKELILAGKSLKEIIQYKKKSRELMGAEIIDAGRSLLFSRKLTSQAKERIKAEQKRAEFGKKYAEVGGKLYKLQQGEVRTLKDSASAFGQRLKGMAKYGAGMAGIQLSLAGIVALIIEAIDKSNKLGGMSMQIAAQWGKGNENVRAASGMIGEIRGNFQKMLAEAGPIAISLARSGFELKNMQQLTSELIAAEAIYGQGIQEQANYIKGLVANFGLADIEASNYLETIRQASATIPMLSMSEATQDWAELIDKTKVFNTDLLGTLSLYNALMRKDVAKELGLGDAPRVVRKEIAKTVAGFSRDLADGWKAALGEGTTAAGRIIEFEDLAPEEQFERMAKFVHQKTVGFFGAQREIAARKVLEKMGFAKEARIELGRAFAAGGFDTSGLRNMMVALKKNKDTMEDVQKKAREDRQEMINKGMAIADLLTGLLHDLKVKLETLIMELGRILKELKNFSLPEIGKTIGSAVYDALHPGETKGRLPREILAGSRVSRKYKEEFGGAEQWKPVAKALGYTPEAQQRGYETYKGLESIGKSPGIRQTREQGARAISLLFKETATAAEFKRVLGLVRRGTIDEAVNIITKVVKDQVTVEDAVMNAWESSTSGYVDYAKLYKTEKG